VETGHWRLLEAVEHRYGKDEIAEKKADEIALALPDRLEDLALRSGRPRQLPWSDLRQQASLRAAVGQPDIEYRIAICERLAQPLLPLAAALAAFALTLRLRRGKPRPPPLASALALALILVLGLWALSVVAHAAAVGGTIAPPFAAAVPLAVCALLSVAAL
jgi:lipopolysaccharide export LptBFGC system permease protein LptF